VAGVQNIASGNFRQRIDLPFGGELGELIRSFNEMAQRLKKYEEQNIEELTAEKAKLETLVSTIADGALLLDSDMRIVLANPAAIKIMGWDQDLEKNTWQGKSILNILPDRLSADLGRSLMQIATGDREGGEFRIMASGEKGDSVLAHAFRIWITSVLSSSNAIKGIAITIQDITREVELNAAQSRFISNVSHELRTPLFNIKSFIETLHEYGDELSDDQKKEFLGTANNETDRLTRLVNDVLDLSRLESGRQYHFTAIDLSETIEQTVRTYKLNASSKGVELLHEISPNLERIWGNYDLILQVLYNLVGNALKFTETGGKVTIRIYPWQDQTTTQPHRVVNYVRVEVEDTGYGIPAEDCDRIFDRFYRVEDKVHTLEGTGLGLSIVRNIIEKHHSEIHIKSEVGVGSTFWFDLSVYQDRCELPVVAESNLSLQAVSV
jgi:two-component system sensor histidine kinase NblS